MVEATVTDEGVVFPAMERVRMNGVDVDVMLLDALECISMKVSCSGGVWVTPKPWVVM